MNNLQIYNSKTFAQAGENLYLYFTLGGKKYALRVSNILEIINLPELDYPQHLPNNILGLLNYNSFTINVLDVRFYLGIEPTEYKASNKLIVVKTDESIFALMADSVCNILFFENSKIEQLPFVSENKLIDSIYHLEEDSISVLNPYSIELMLKKGTEKSDFDVQALFPKDDESRYLIKKRTSELMKKQDVDVMRNVFAQDKFLSFELNQGLWGINLESVKEVLKDAAVTKIPCAPEYIEGIMTLRGDFITIVNLKKFLGLSADTDNEKNRVIVVQNDSFNLGFSVDNICEIADIPDGGTADKFIGQGAEFVLKEFAQNDKLYLLLNLQKLLADERLYS